MAERFAMQRISPLFSPQNHTYRETWKFFPTEETKLHVIVLLNTRRDLYKKGLILAISYLT